MRYLGEEIKIHEYKRRPSSIDSFDSITLLQKSFSRFIRFKLICMTLFLVNYSKRSTLEYLVNLFYYIYYTLMKFKVVFEISQTFKQNIGYNLRGMLKQIRRILFERKSSILFLFEVKSMMGSVEGRLVF